MILNWTIHFPHLFLKYEHSFPEVFYLYNIILNAHICTVKYTLSIHLLNPVAVHFSSARKLAGIPWHIDIWYQMAAYHFFFVICNGTWLFLNIYFRFWIAFFAFQIRVQIFLSYLPLSFKIFPRHTNDCSCLILVSAICRSNFLLNYTFFH